MCECSQVDDVGLARGSCSRLHCSVTVTAVLMPSLIPLELQAHRTVDLHMCSRLCGHLCSESSCACRTLFFNASEIFAPLARLKTMLEIICRVSERQKLRIF